MKLKNIFLSLLTLAALAACSEEVIVGPDNGNGQDKGLPAVLMINGSTSGDVETKADTHDNSKQGDLYVFVFDDEGNFLGKGCSVSEKESVESRLAKVSTILSQNGKTDLDVIVGDKDVVVSEQSMVSGTVVDVVLIANPTNKIKDIYGGNVSLDELNAAMTDLATQVDMFEKGSTTTGQLVGEFIGKSTSCQRIKMTLARGVNYCGGSILNSKGESITVQDNKDYWKNQYKRPIPLFRLLSRIYLSSIHCPGSNKRNFILQSLYIDKGFCNNSYMIPSTPLELQSVSIIGDDNNNIYNSFCGNLKSGENSSELGNELFIKGVKLPYPNYGPEAEGIIFGFNTGADPGKGEDWSEHVHWPVVYNDRSIGWTGSANNCYWHQLLKSTYAFESDEPVTLIVKGMYYESIEERSRSLTPKEVMENGTKVSYKIEIANNDGKFRRGYVYKVHLTILGMGTPEGGPEPSVSGASANIEIANMAEANPDFTFGE